jgi:hypothetical protein
MVYGLWFMVYGLWFMVHTELCPARAWVEIIHPKTINSKS